MCLTPMLASSEMSFSGRSLTEKMMGSIRTETGMPALIGPALPEAAGRAVAHRVLRFLRGCHPLWLLLRQL